MVQESDMHQDGKTGSHNARQPQSEEPTALEQTQVWPDNPNVSSAHAQNRGSLDDLFDLMSLIWHRIKLVTLVTLLFSVLGFFCAYQQQDVFESSAEVNLMQAATAANTLEASRSGSQDASYVTGEMRFLSSPRLSKRFVESLQPSESSLISVTHRSLTRLFAQMLATITAAASRVVRRNVPDDKMGTRPERSVSSREDEMDGLDKRNITRAFHQSLSVRLPDGLGREYGIVQVSLRANRPVSAQKLLQSFLEFYGRIVRDRLRSDLETQVSQLEKRYAKAEQKWLESKKNLADFAHVSGIVPGADNVLAPSVNLLNKSLERIVEAREQKERIRSLYHRDAESKKIALGRIREHRLLTDLRQQLETLEGKYAGWKTVYSANAPKMINLRQRINHLQELMSDMTELVTHAALESASREEKIRERTLDEARKEAERINSLQARYVVLRRKTEIDNRACQRLLNALGGIDIRSATIPLGATIIEPPTLPSVPVAPGRVLIITVGIALGLICGVTLAWTMENMASSLKVLDVEKIATEIDTLPLGIVPDFTLSDHDIIGSTNREDLQGLPHDLAGNAVMHSIREIETSLFFLHCGDQPRMTMVSSAIAQEGKTFFATSLSYAMSTREGQKTLVVDADMRSPRVHQVFGHEDAGAGLSTVLTDRNIKLSQVIRRSQVPGLWYLTAGPVPADSLALLRSQRFRQILCKLEENFDNIVIDSPPVLSVPDYMPLCHLVKAVILVARQGKTLREEVRKCAGLIRSVPNASILGVVLNRVGTSPSRYRSSLYGHSRYHYRYFERYNGQDKQNCAQ